MRRSHRQLLVTTASIGLAAAAALPAAATGGSATSQPNGDYDLQIRVGSTTDKDRDGSSDTATAPDKLITLYTVCGRQAEGTDPGIVQLNFTVDAPGSAFDERFSRVADLERFSCVNLWVDDKVEAQWPAGTYTVTIDADNGRDTATASGSVAIG